jgi:cobaltochelatase CobN
LLPKLYEATRNPVFLDSDQHAIDNPESNHDASNPNPGQGTATNSGTVSNSTSSVVSNSSSYNMQNSNGQAVSNIGINGQSESVGDPSYQGESSSVNEVSNAENANVKKSIEINPITQQSASEVGLSIIAVLGVLCLIGVIAVGYFRNKDDDEKITDLDKLFNEMK